jgi:hypothetical protein
MKRRLIFPTLLAVSSFSKHFSRRNRPGQEAGNIPFVENAGFGKYSGDPSEIAGIVSSWLSSPETLSAMQQAALAAARPRATVDIARDLAQILFAHKQGQEQESEKLIEA